MANLLDKEVRKFLEELSKEYHPGGIAWMKGNQSDLWECIKKAEEELGCIMLSFGAKLEEWGSLYREGFALYQESLKKDETQ